LGGNYLLGIKKQQQQQQKNKNQIRTRNTEEHEDPKNEQQGQVQKLCHDFVFQRRDQLGAF